MQTQSIGLSKIENIPLVTIYMVCYRKFEHVYETLDSIMEQDYPNYELIVADDGSENFPKREITTYIHEHASDNLKRVLIYSNEKNLGTVENCNTAIKRGRGKYITGISPDDMYSAKDVVSSVVKEFQSSNALVITGKREIITEDGARTGKILPDENGRNKIRFMEPDELYEELLQGNFLADTFYDRKCFERYEIFDERFTLLEDWPSHLLLLKQQVKIHFFDKLTWLHRIGGVSTSGTPSQAYIDDCYKLYEYYKYPYIKKKIKIIIDPIKKQAIYGTGNESKRIFEVLRMEGIEPLCYIVSDGFSTKNSQNSLPVYQLSEIPFRKDEIQVLVSQNQTDAESIIDDLKKRCFTAGVLNESWLPGIPAIMAQARSFRRQKMKATPLVTIFMVCYREFEHVYETLDSVLEQDYPNYELIVGDDNSENFPEKEIAGYIHKHATHNLKRVCIYSNEKNLGIVKNCNVAIRKGRGRYFIGISPGDAYAGRDVVSCVVKEFQNSNAAVVTSKQEFITKDGARTGEILPDENTRFKIQSAEPDELYAEMVKGQVVIGGASTYYDRRCFEQYKLFDERFFLMEDTPAYWYLSKNKEKIHFLDKITFLRRSGGISSWPWPQAMIDDMRKVFEYYGYAYIQSFIRELIDPQKKQVIYGTGSESDRILTLLHREQIKPLCYMVSNGFSTENKKNGLPVYHMADFPFQREKVQILVSEIQTDAAKIIDSLKSECFSSAIIKDFWLRIVKGIYFMDDSTKIEK